MPECGFCGATIPTAAKVCPACNAPVLADALHDLILSKYQDKPLAGRYKILSRLGMGGMGGVYKALDQELNEVMAIKLLRPELQMDVQSLQRFKLETKTTRKLRHPNIVGMFDLYWGDEIKFITMELVEGITLRTLIKTKGPLPIPHAIDLMVQILRALEEAHRQGVIHRDIKPGNVMLVPRPENPDLYTVKVADFGIAKIVTEESGVTTTGLIIGTPEYMSPEQAEGRPIGPQSDIYSAGILFYEMLTGDVPFRADTPMATAIKHIKDTPRQLRELCPRAPERLERLVMRMLAKRTAERWQTAGEIRELLEKRTSLFTTPDSTVEASQPSELERMKRFDETKKEKHQEESRAQQLAKKTLAPPPPLRSSPSFPWKWAALLALGIVLVGGAVIAYKQKIVTLNKVSFPGFGKFAGSSNDMVLVPAGECLIGTSEDAAKRIAALFPDSEPGWTKDEKPAHRVSVKAFYMDSHEVTNEEYKKFLDITKHPAPFSDEEWAKEYNWQNNTYPPGKEKHPVVLVSWEDAQAYARWAEKRLPTETEWERAARGGVEDALWPWGDEWDAAKVNTWEGEARGTRPVGSYPPNQYGLYDLAGNVWEWCSDWYREGYQAGDSDRDPQGPSVGVNKVARGGSWSNNGFTSRCAERKQLNPKSQFNSIGFRCVKDK
jgi:eukaryotic-like serine/threonine-protein kinase